MKSFKQFLIEIASPEASDSSQRNIVPPGSIPPPKMPAPTRLDPDSLPPGHDRPRQPDVPQEIDWEELNQRIQEFLNLYRALIQLLGILSWDQFVEYMKTHYGVTTLGDRYDFDLWFRLYSQGKLQDWWDNNYPDANHEQYLTFLERVSGNGMGSYDTQQWEVFDQEVFPSDIPPDDVGPSERDRERALERWEREHY